MIDRHTLANGYISATIKAQGAELCSLRDAKGREVLWQAHPPWERHAPILFPIVGRLKNDTLHHEGKSYTLTQHGFARDRRFAWLQRNECSCSLALQDDAGTRSGYPFAFRLEVSFSLDADTLVCRFITTNPGRSVLPASIGAHPAFLWPIRPDIEKTAHQIVFERDEGAPVRRLTGGLLKSKSEATPVTGRTLALTPKLFDADAVIFDRLASANLQYMAHVGETIEVSWKGFYQLGIWHRAGGDFLCIEPWHGTASPEDFDGEFGDKPGLMLIQPGDSQTCIMRIRIL